MELFTDASSDDIDEAVRAKIRGEHPSIDQHGWCLLKVTTSGPGSGIRGTLSVDVAAPDVTYRHMTECVFITTLCHK